MENKRIRINIGGSNRKLQRDVILLRQKFGDAFIHYPGSRSIGMHHSNQSGTIPDTPENRIWLKENKISKARRQ